MFSNANVCLGYKFINMQEALEMSADRMNGGLLRQVNVARNIFSVHSSPIRSTNPRQKFMERSKSVESSNACRYVSLNRSFRHHNKRKQRPPATNGRHAFPRN